MSDIVPEKRFMTNVNGLLDLVSEIVQIANKKGITKLTKGLIDIISGFLRAYKGPLLMVRFIENSVEFWDQIYFKQENFFLENASKVFGSLPMKDVNMFKDLIGHPEIVDAETKEAIWNYFQSFVKISIKYAHSVKSKDSLKFACVDTVVLAKKWKITLPE
jgi:hypothetical protein